MSWQNGRNSRGLSPAQPITPHRAREKCAGQTKGVHQNAIMVDITLPTDNQQTLLCPNSEIFQQYNQYRTKTVVMPQLVWSLSIMNEYGMKDENNDNNDKCNTQ